MKKLSIAFISAILASCASIDFDSEDEGLIYFEPKPHLFFSVTDKCISSVSVITLPGAQKKINFEPGYGSSALSAGFSNGVITSVGLTSDSKIPETITSIASLGTAGLIKSAGEAGGCKPVAVLFPFVDGKPDVKNPINFTIGQ